MRLFPRDNFNSLVSLQITSIAMNKPPQFPRLFCIMHDKASAHQNIEKKILTKPDPIATTFYFLLTSLIFLKLEATNN